MAVMMMTTIGPLIRAQIKWQPICPFTLGLRFVASLGVLPSEHRVLNFKLLCRRRY